MVSTGVLFCLLVTLRTHAAHIQRMDMHMNTSEHRSIGDATFTDIAGNPIHTRYSTEDIFMVSEMQDAEENPALRTLAA